jgi:LuxR family transcriptional regulator, maltose regulon positive regulatory protein
MSFDVDRVTSFERVLKVNSAASDYLVTPLTPRELELLSLMTNDMDTRQLAKRLDISITTVKWHRLNLFTKLGVTTRAGALITARGIGLLPPRS